MSSIRDLSKIFWWLFLLSTAICQGTPASEDVGSLDWVCSVAVEGKDSIPYAIAQIANDEPALVSLTNPIRSTIPEFAMNPLRGIHAAYAVELVLSRSYKDVKDCKNAHTGNPSTHTGNPSSQRRTYDIVHIKRPRDRGVDKDDLRRIQKYYSEWWTNHKHLPLHALRAIWEAGDRPLSGTEYTWI
jgi:hypothetical protein